jgi:hypothetical protein
MTFEELMNRINEFGITKGSLEKRCGFYGGKLTELGKGRMVVSSEHIEKIAAALEELSEELSLLAEEARSLDMTNVGQYCVYELSFPDGKVYYGSTVNPEMRWKNGEGYNTQKVGEAIKQFGWENVKKKIIAEKLTKQNAMLIERTLIKATGSDMPGLGYNIY